MNILTCMWQKIKDRYNLYREASRVAQEAKHASHELSKELNKLNKEVKSHDVAGIVYRAMHGSSQ